MKSNNIVDEEIRDVSVKYFFLTDEYYYPFLILIYHQDLSDPVFSIFYDIRKRSETRTHVVKFIKFQRVRYPVCPNSKITHDCTLVKWDT